MAFASIGPVTSQDTGSTSASVLTMTSTVPVGTLVVVVAGHDSSLIEISSIVDAGSNSWEWDEISSSSGYCAVAWSLLDTQLDSGSDEITVDWNGTADVMVRAYAFSGVSAADVTSSSKVYTESTSYTFSMNNTSGEDALMIAAFCFPFDFGVSDTPTGWTKFSSITDTADSETLAFYKQIGTGVNTLTESVGVTVAYVSAGVILPYLTSSLSRRNQVVSFF
jgi:hypothetical protein